jgi:hypothetical protein
MADERIPCVKCGDPTPVIGSIKRPEHCNPCALERWPWDLTHNDKQWLRRKMRISPDEIARWP